MSYLLVAWIALWVGIAVGSCWRVRTDRKREQNRRLRLLLLGVSASVAANRYVEHAELPDLARREDLAHERMN